MEQPIHATRVVPSVPVPNVEDLAAKVISSVLVPERYIRPELESQIVIGIPDVDIPVIEMERLLDPQLSKDEAARLDFACQEWGFFQLVNHGLPNHVTEKIKNDVMEFYHLPLEEKKVFAQAPKSLEGYGQSMVSAENQKLDWADMLYLVTQPVHCRSMEVWPSNPSSLRESLSNYSLELKKLASYLLEVMAKNMGVNLDVFLNKFDDISQRIKMNYYPPCPKANVLGNREHSDAVSALTLVLEVNGVEGLQIKRNGKWFAVKSLPGAFIVNVGDILEILTNGKYKSIEHRVMVNNKKERVSIAAFHAPIDDAIVGPLPELVVKDGKTNYKTMVYKDLMRSYFTSRFEGKVFIENNKLARE